jgi:class 3 adenylate cyclase/tetratricopeptide (TPR) repeat protein
LVSTRVVTLLFTDLVSSTEISHRLGEDAAEAFRRGHFRVLRDAISGSSGEEVKNLGDGLMVVFDSPSDAVTCAVTMQQAVEHHNRRAAERLDVRVGLHTGEVTQEDDDYFGSAVVVAERLCKLAEPGQVLASDVLRLIVGSRGAHAFRDVGALELKGVPDPVNAVEVGWEPVAAQSILLPHALSLVEVNEFVGRGDEREKLFDAFKLSRGGDRRLVFLVGEPGMGKSRLCSEFAREAYAAGATVLYGRCDEESLAPYQPFVEALRHYVSACPADELRAQTGQVADDLVRLVPDLGRRLTDVKVQPMSTDADTDRLRLFEAVKTLLAGAASEHPIVLVLDDLHWADRPTLQLLRYLLRTEPFPILIVATYRETDLDRTHPLSAALADIRRDHPFERFHLKGLDADEIAIALEHGAGHPVGRRGQRLAEALERATDGNPFFILQILGHLTDTGRIYEQHGVWTFDVQVEELGIPEGVKEVIGRRISSLSEGANKALSVAAVIGRDFDLSILERVAEIESDELVDGLDEAVRAGIVLETRGRTDRYSFAHALVRETLYEELTATRRVRLHRKFAAVFEELSEGDPDRFVSELAYHMLEAAQVAEVDKAIEYARRAAVQAVSLLAYEAGVRLYERALSALELREEPDETTRCDLLSGLGDAQSKTGDLEASRASFRRALEIARALGDIDRFASAALGLAGAPEASAPDASDLMQLEDALVKLPPDDGSLRARLMARLSTALFGDQTQAERRANLAREAVDMARRTGDLRTIAFTLRAALVILWEPTETEKELVFADEVVRLAEQAGDKELLASGHFWRAILLLWLGDVRAFDVERARVAELADELKQPFLKRGVLQLTACQLAMTGDLENAERVAQEAYELGQSMLGSLALAIYGIQLIAIRWAQGRVAELEPIVRAQAEASPQIPAWRCTLAFIHAESGRRDDAREGFDDLAERGFALPRDAAWPIGIARLSLVCSSLGDERRASTLYDLFAPYAGKNVVVGAAASSAGSSDRYLGLLAATMSRWDAAEQHFHDAIDQNEAMEARPFTAFTIYDYSNMLLRRNEPGDVERAHDLLDRALVIARDVGMTGLEERIASTREQAPA